MDRRGALSIGALLLAAMSQAAARQPMAREDALAQTYALADARRFDGAALAALSSHPDATVREATIRTLGHLANPAALPLLERATADDDPGVRGAVAEAAGRLAADLTAVPGERQRAMALLTRLLGDRDPAVRRAAAWGTGMAADGFAALLERLRTDPDADVRASMLAELWRFKTDWIPVASAALDATDRQVRFSAAWSLARSGSAAATEALKRATRDSDPAVRAIAFEGARRGQARSFRDELARGIEDKDPRVRIAALGALAQAFEAHGGEAASPALVRRLQVKIADRGPSAVQERVMAIRAAGAAGCCGAELRALAADQGTWVGAESLAALVRQGAADAGPLVAGWLASEKPAVRAAAVEALGKRDALPADEVLLGLLGKENGAAVPDAAVALVEAVSRGKALTPAVEQALEGLMAGGDPVLARAAWDALRSHGIAGPLPAVETRNDLAFYRRLVEWAATPRWLQIVTVRGTMLLTLDTAAAPLAAFRLSELAAKGFFNDLTFHRVVPDFVVQGGDPHGDGRGGPGFVMRDEESLAPFGPGAVGLALAGPDTGGSQLFVTLTRQPHLDGRYPYLGRVVAGLDAAERLRRGDRIVRVAAGEGPLPTLYPVWYGRLDAARLDGAIQGWKQEREAAKPQEKWLALLRTAKLRYELTVAMGTWCSDSREQIPRLQAVLAALGDRSPFAAPELIGIDRSKEVDRDLYRFGPVEKVPTIVVTTGGSEVGRIVETPSSGSIEEDLVRILAPMEGWEVPHE